MSLDNDIRVAFLASVTAMNLAELVVESDRQIHGFAKNRQRMIRLARKVISEMTDLHRKANQAGKEE